MNPNYLSDPLTFRLVPLAGQSSHLSSEISKATAWIGTKICTDIHIP